MEKNKFLKLTPMLLQEIDEPFNSAKHLYEIKFDGLRALFYINKDEIIIKSRRNIILNDIYPELLKIKNMTKDICILDGEIVLMEDGKPSFSRLQERARLKNKDKIKFMQDNYPVTFVCFDILYKNEDLTNLPLINRKKILNKFKDNKVFCKSKYIENDGIKLFNFVKEQNLEGIIAKLKNSEYLYNKRTNYWLKIKNFKTEEFYIYGYINEEKNYIITLILGEQKNKEHIFVGKVILGKKDKLYNDLIKEQKISNKYLLDIKDKKITFIKPKYKITVSYMERTKNNMLRQPFIKK